MGTPTNPTVELFYGGAWHNVTITDDVMAFDPITITRGRAPGSQRVAPSTCSLTLKGDTGKYSPRNPSSPLYGLIGRNTPLRVTVDGVLRFVGEVETWPPTWDVSGKDVNVSVVAYGILRRINAPGTVVKTQSAMRRAIAAGTAPRAYWPLDDGQLTTGGQLAIGTATRMALVNVHGGSQFGVADMAPWLEQGVTLEQDSTMSATITGISSSPTRLVLDFVKRGNTGQLLVEMYGDNIDLGLRWKLFFTAGAFNDLEFYLYQDGVQQDHQTFHDDPLGNGVPGALFDSRPHHIRLDATSGGGSINHKLYVDGVLVKDSTLGFIAALTKVSKVAASFPTLGTIQGATVTLSHMALWDGTPPAIATVSAAAAGYTGETAAARITRLCSEEGIALVVVGSASEQVGPQKIATIPDLLYDAAVADGGILYETRGVLGLTYKTRTSLYNQAASISARYLVGGEVAPPLFPVEDTDHIANDVTVKRYLGGQAQVVKTTGTLNVQPPPAGVGRYPIAPEHALLNDDQLLQQAAWLRALGTWDEARYPVIHFDVTAMLADGKTALAAAAAALDIGQRVSISNLPAWLPPDSIEQLAQGFVEVIATHYRTIAVNATPALPFDVLQLETSTGNNLSRIPAADGATVLAQARDATATAIAIISKRVPWIDTVSYGAQFPFDIVAAGERMRVTANGAGASGTITTPATFSYLAQMQIPEGTWVVKWTVQLAGTVGAPEANNFGIVCEFNAGGDSGFIASVNAGAVGTYPQADVTITVPSGGGNLAIKNGGNAATSGAQYTGLIVQPQSMTVVRSINGVVKSHAQSEPVQLFRPPVIAR